MSNGQDYSTRGIVDRMQAAIAPTFRQGAQAVRQAASGAARRRGTFGAFDIASQATEPFGAQMGKAAAAAGVAGEELGAQMERQQRDLLFQREQLAESKRAEEARIQEMMRGRQQQGQLSLLGQTGFTQEMLQSLGYPGTPREPFGPRNQLGTFQRSLEGMQRQGQLPGIPSGGSRFGAGSPNWQFQMQRAYPGMSRAMRMMQAQNLGLISGPIQPGQFQR